MSRLRFNFIGGQITDNPLTSGATTMNSDGLAALPTIASPDYAAITLDPDGIEGSPEIAWITAHTAAATSATVSRGQEGTTALQHSQDIYWAHGPTLQDFDGQGGGSGLIALTSYAPGTLVTLTTTQTTHAANLDATNLKVTFVAPYSGKVKVHLAAAFSMSANTSFGYWALRDGSGLVAQGSAAGSAKENVLSNDTLWRRTFADLMISDLTGGASYTWYWSMRQDGTDTARLRASGGSDGYGPALMEVWGYNV